MAADGDDGVARPNKEDISSVSHSRNNGKGEIGVLLLPGETGKNPQHDTLGETRTARSRLHDAAHAPADQNGSPFGNEPSHPFSDSLGWFGAHAFTNDTDV